MRRPRTAGSRSTRSATPGRAVRITTRGGRRTRRATRSSSSRKALRPLTEPEPNAGDVVVLALPYGALAEVTEQYGDQLAGKTVVDVTNPIDFTTFDSVVAPYSSATEELAGKLPAAHVVKAFDTNFAATLASGEANGRPTTVMAASDSDEGKAAVRSFVEAAGLSFIDAGALKRAERLEAIGALQIELAMSEQIGWTAGLNVTK